MLKVARKPSADPVQEKLRQDKASLNKTVSEFIDDLIHFKKLMNGHPNKFHMEKGKITDPVPADAVTIIGSLANDFNDISSKTNKIIQQQIDYSKNRRKKQPKQMNLPFEGSNSSKQLNLPSVASADYNLLAEGSNPFSRFFARLLNPSIGGSEKARLNKYRMSLLNSAADTWKNLEKLQEIIMMSSPESIFAASKLLNKIQNQWSFMKQGVTTYESLALNVPSNQNSTKVTETPDQSLPQNKSTEALKDFLTYSDNFTEFNLKSIKNLALSFSKDSNLESEFLTAYNNLLSEANSKLGTNGISLSDIFNQRNKLKSEAQNFISKYLGKAKHHINPFDKTSAFRLDVYKFSKEAKKNVDKIMDSLEKGLDLSELKFLINDVNDSLQSISQVMMTLNSTVRGVNFDSSFMNLLEDRNVFEHGPNLNNDQKERLRKLIELKNLRNITKSYNS